MKLDASKICVGRFRAESQLLIGRTREDARVNPGPGRNVVRKRKICMCRDSISVVLTYGQTLPSGVPVLANMMDLVFFCNIDVTAPRSVGFRPLYNMFCGRCEVPSLFCFLN
jgi:hypothetical protein